MPDTATRAMPGCVRFSSAIASTPQAPGMNMSVTIRAGARRPHRGADRATAVLGLLHLVAGAFEPVGDQVAQDRVIVDDEDIARGVAFLAQSARSSKMPSRVTYRPLPGKVTPVTGCGRACLDFESP